MRDAAELENVVDNHHCLMAVCNALEAVADSLPNSVDHQQCLLLSRALRPLLSRAQHIEEDDIFPALLTLQQLRPELGEIIERLKLEHQLDLCYAEEVQDMLKGYGEGRRDVSPDAAGFMLRGFFESLRRHVAFEQELLLPLMQLVEARTVRQALAS